MCRNARYIWTVCGHGAQQFVECSLRRYRRELAEHVDVHQLRGWKRWLAENCCFPVFPVCHALPAPPGPPCEEAPQDESVDQFVYGFCPDCTDHYTRFSTDLGHEGLFIVSLGETRDSEAFLCYWAMKRKRLTDFDGHPMWIFWRDPPELDLTSEEFDREIREFDAALKWNPGGLYEDRIAYLKLLRKLTLRWADEIAGKPLDKYELTSTERIYSENGPLLFGYRQPLAFAAVSQPIFRSAAKTSGARAEDIDRSDVAHSVVEHPAALSPGPQRRHSVTVEEWEARIGRDIEDFNTETCSTLSEDYWPVSPNRQPGSIHMTVLTPRPRFFPSTIQLPDPDIFESLDSPLTASPRTLVPPQGLDADVEVEYATAAADDKPEKISISSLFEEAPQ
ncbi:hypothetical protein B0T16DRAFT_398126 [Cercophora newfieldiana]|uniref:Uncharacterized protein n=1 Tax=Cercophora newfieldiana TaxID=92897 RepID=A0AA39YQN2_9PEZI|nr:hypothetical protein B0T16DRAFT_398126 [Cercophora newfieldiana]